MIRAIAVCFALLVGCRPPAPHEKKDAGLTLTIAPNETLEGARDRIRELRRENRLPRGPITVVVRGGTYFRTHPFELTAEDSGSADSPITYRAASGETVRIVGGRRIDAALQAVPSPLLARVPAVARPYVRFIDLDAENVAGVDLFIDGAPGQMARWPDEGWAHITDVPSAKPVDVRGIKGDASGRIVVDTDRLACWAGEPDTWLHGYWFWDWADERQRVSAIDVAHHEITLAPPLHHYGYRKGQRFYAYNLLSELDHPGEWYLDHASGALVVWPPANMHEMVVSVASELVTMKDTSYVRLDGLRFEAAQGNGVTITGGIGDVIDECTVANVGGWGVRISGGEKHTVARSEIAQTGQGGIFVDGGERATLVSSGHAIDGNRIHHFARVDRTRQPGISVEGVGNEVTRNVIEDAPHSAIFFAGNDHLIDGNSIRHVCTETDDAGAIYGGRDWTMRGTKIRRNDIADVGSCNGVYLDDMFSGTEVTENTFVGVARGVFIGGGRDNIVADNKFVDCAHPVHLDARGLGWASYSIPTMEAALAAVPYRSALWAQRYPRLATIASEQPAAPLGNLVGHNERVRCGPDEIDDTARKFLVDKL